MTDVTVRSLAKAIKIPVERLIQQFADAGLNKTAVDFVTSREKEILLFHLNKGRKIIVNKLILRRKTRSTLNVPGISGKNKQVQVEVRKKRIYVAPESPQSYRQIISDDSVDVKVMERKKQHDIVINYDNTVSGESIDVFCQSSKGIDNFSKDVELTKITREDKEIVQHKVKSKFQLQKVTGKLPDVITSKNINSRQYFASSINVGHNNNNFSVLHHISSKKVEGKNNHKPENDRRSRSRARSKSRGLKSVKFKKNNNCSMYEFKDEREEIRFVNRSVKINKQRSQSSNNNNNLLVQAFNKPTKFVNRDVVIGETVSVAELANKMAIKSSYLIKTMMTLGITATINQVIDQDTAQLVAEELGHNVILYRENALEELVMHDRDVHDYATVAEVRAPIVAVMGHVDHGKTSLLDYIRSTRVVATEVGGITQHIGAYHVKTNNGMITFLDTPGHSAFTAMRARGTKITDIVILVVAADDGVMLQTIEAIQHAKDAQVPMIVAINKIDKPEIDLDRIKNELSQYGIVPEEWGGDNQFVNISAKLGIGIDDLLEAVLLQAEILELKTVFDGMASGVVIEASLDKGRGPVATVLIREGTLKRGDVVLCGLEYGRIRYMRDEMGNDISSAGPSVPVEIFGLSGSPIAGDIITVVRDERKAREVAFYRQGKFREVKLAGQKRNKLKDAFSNIVNELSCAVSEVNIVLKSDFQGSSEAIIESLKALSTDKVKIKIVYASVGGITETDAALAVASNAILLGFNVRADFAARRVIDMEKIDARYYSVIYDLINAVKQILDNLLIPKYKQATFGLAEVRNVFRSSKFGVIAGCMVIEGTVKRSNKVRVLRNNVAVYEGELESLRRFKDDVNEVRHGMECGIGVKNYIDICSGDLIEVFEVTKN